MTFQIKALTWGYANGLDKGVYSESYKAGRFEPSNERTNHSNLRVITRKTLVVITTLLVTFGPSTVASAALSSSQAISNYKLYAHNKIYDATAYECFTILVERESHWNPKAKNNAGHYGLVQGESKWLSTVDAYQQIDWALSYIAHRYSSICAALNHSTHKGWY